MFVVNTMKKIKKLIIALVGFTVLIIGLALIVLPGPAILVIPAGLAILSIEFVWARNLLKRMREKLNKNKNSVATPGEGRK
jgi:uncharacterized protein (TIGR02611 family)